MEAALMSEDYNPDSLQAVLSRIDTRLADHVRETKEYRGRLDTKLEAHGTRLASLETDRNKALGMAAGAGTIGGWLVSLFHK